jgi:hypothetical protein
MRELDAHRGHDGFCPQCKGICQFSWNRHRLSAQSMKARHMRITIRKLREIIELGDLPAVQRSWKLIKPLLDERSYRKGD